MPRAATNATVLAHGHSGAHGHPDGGALGSPSGSVVGVGSSGALGSYGAGAPSSPSGFYTPASLANPSATTSPFAIAAGAAPGPASDPLLAVLQQQQQQQHQQQSQMPLSISGAFGGFPAASNTKSATPAHLGGGHSSGDDARPVVGSLLPHHCVSVAAVLAGGYPGLRGPPQSCHALVRSLCCLTHGSRACGVNSVSSLLVLMLLGYMALTITYAVIALQLLPTVLVMVFLAVPALVPPVGFFSIVARSPTSARAFALVNTVASGNACLVLALVLWGVAYQSSLAPPALLLPAGLLLWSLLAAPLARSLVAHADHEHDVAGCRRAFFTDTLLEQDMALSSADGGAAATAGAGAGMGFDPYSEDTYAAFQMRLRDTGDDNDY